MKNQNVSDCNYYDLQDLFSTAMEFSKLEKVELGGIKGKMLSHQVVEIFEEFSECFAVFGNRTYDGLDATNKVGEVCTTSLIIALVSIQVNTIHFWWCEVFTFLSTRRK